MFQHKCYVALIAPVLLTLLGAVSLGDNPRQKTDIQRAPTATPLHQAAGSVLGNESWSQIALANLEHMEYEAYRGKEGFQAPNRAQNLRTTFRHRGIEVVPRRDPSRLPWKMRMA